MSARPPRFDADLLAAALGDARPATFDREGRIRLCGEFANAVIAGEAPARESLLFVAGAISGWLSNGGNLERDYLRVVANGSHNTPCRIWKALQSQSFERRTHSDGAGNIAASSLEKEIQE